LLRLLLKMRLHLKS